MQETYIISCVDILSNWSTHLCYYSVLGLLGRCLKNSKCCKLQEIDKLLGDGMIRYKNSSVFWQKVISVLAKL